MDNRLRWKSDRQNEIKADIPGGIASIRRTGKFKWDLYVYYFDYKDGEAHTCLTLHRALRQVHRIIDKGYPLTDKLMSIHIAAVANQFEGIEG